MKRVFTALSVCAALSFAGCVDQEFDLADTSGEVTIGGEELVVPLAEIAPIHLGDVIEDNEYFNSNGENGAYQVQFSSFGDDPSKYESVKVDGISIPTITGLSPKLDPIGFSFQQLPTSLSMEGISQTFKIDYPTINDNFIKVDPIKMEQTLDLTLPISGQGSISEQQLQILQMQNLNVIKNQYSSSFSFNADIELLEQLKKVDWVEFGSAQHPYGAPFEVKVDLQGLQDVVGGGSITLNIEFPQGYKLRDENGNDLKSSVANKNIVSKELAISPKQKRAEFLIYLHRIDYSDHEAVNGKMEINDIISYSYDLSLNLAAGNYNLNSLPKITIEAAPEYKDMEVIINSFDLPGASYPINYAFNGMPNGVSVEKIAFKNTYLPLSLKGLEWLNVIDNTTGNALPVKIKITLPECMNFEQSSYLQGNVLSASAKDLANGIRLKLNSIDCKANGIKQENGQLMIDSNISAEIDLNSMNGCAVLVSSLTPPQSPIEISVGIADTQLTLDLDNTKVSWSGDQSFDLDFGENTPSISQSIEVPSMIAAIKEIEIGNANKAGEPVKIGFKLASNAGFPVDELEVNVAINLGKMLRPTQSSLESGIIKQLSNGVYILSINETWKPNEAPLAKEIAFEAIQNINIENGKAIIKQSFPVTGSVKIKGGQNIDLANIDSAKINIDVAVDDIEVRSFTGALDFALTPDQMVFELGDFSNLGIDLNNLSLNPILDIKLKDNPTNIPLSGDISIKALDKSGKTTHTLTIPTINVAGSGPTHLVLSTPRNAAKYAGVEGVTFLAIEDLSELLTNGIPAKVALDMSVKTDKNEIITIDLAKAKAGYNIEYQYSFVMPIEVDGDTSVSFESTILELGETFAELADTANGLKVGDVGLVAEFGSTIPVNVVLSAELVNANGTTDGVEARLNINNCVIAGYNKETDGEKKISTIDLDFDLGESGSLAGLKTADGVRFKLSIYGANNSATPLTKDQYLDCKLKLRVRDGLTIDIFDLLN